MRTRSYSELRRLSTFEERFEYLCLFGQVGRSTFGFDRYINQRFYRSREWKLARDFVIARDEGCDLGIPDREIYADILVHHMNPMTVSHIVHSDERIFDPNFLITTTHRTHNAIHYGNAKLLPPVVAERRPNDTIPWRR